jgi:putative Mg2+ transporter-C (MgtC) family protein
VLVVAVLTLFKIFEIRIPKSGQGHLTLEMADRPGQLGKIGTALGAFGVNIEGVELSQRAVDRVTLSITVRLPSRVSRHELLVALGEIEGVDEVRWEDAAAAA